MNLPMRHESHPTLAHLLEQHWRRLMHETAVSEFAFAASVREAYEAGVPPHARSVEWSTHPDPVSRMRRDAEKLNRWFRDDVSARFPVDVLEAFVAAFPPDRRFALQELLASRQGMLIYPLPRAVPGADGDNLGRIGKETGEAIVALSAMLADGAIDERDAALADMVIEQINEAMAVLAEMRERVERQARAGAVR